MKKGSVSQKGGGRAVTQGRPYVLFCSWCEFAALELGGKQFLAVLFREENYSRRSPSASHRSPCARGSSGRRGSGSGGCSRCVSREITGGYKELMSALAAGNVPNVRTLLTRGMDINARINGMTFLETAIVTRRKEIIQILLEKRADVNATTKSSETALKIATRKGYTHLDEMLRKAGAK